MNPSFRHSLYTSLSALALAALTAVAALLVRRESARQLDASDRAALGMAGRHHEAFDALDRLGDPGDPESSETAPGIAAADWSAITPTAATASLSRDALAERFRLAGTMFKFGEAYIDEPLAILDDRVRMTQILAKRGDEIAPGITLAKVAQKSVTLTGKDGDEELFIENAAPAPAPAKGKPGGIAGAGPDPGDPASRFGGKQVFPGRWEFDREAMISYYSELRDEPERLLAVFDSLEPLWENNDPATRKINGYTLNVQGEPGLFDAMGMRQGDVVRSVNSMPMTNRRRAEQFIRAFVEDSLDTFVLELERDGKTTRQVYIIR